MSVFEWQRWTTTNSSTITIAGLSKGAGVAAPLKIFFCDLLKRMIHSNDLFCHTPGDIKRREKQTKVTPLGPLDCSGQYLVISLHLGVRRLTTSLYGFITTAAPWKVISLSGNMALAQCVNPLQGVECLTASAQVFLHMCCQGKQRCYAWVKFGQVQTGFSEAQNGNLSKSEKWNYQQ